MKTGYLFIIVGPSGVGKSTVVKALLEEINLLKKVVSYTTRPKRGGERDGVDYYFVSGSELKIIMECDESVKRTANQVYGFTYALSDKELTDIFSSKTNGIMELVIDKAIEWKKRLKERTVIIFLLSSPMSIRQRLKTREGEKVKEFRERSGNISYELQVPTLPEYRRFIDYVLVVPRDLEEMKKIITDLVKSILKD